MFRELNRCIGLAGAACLCGALAAVGSVASLASASPSVAHDARVVGKVRLCGGPAPGHCFSQSATVTAYAHHQSIAQQQTHHGRFRFQLLPGPYLLVATSGGAQGQQKVYARKNQTTHTRIVIHIH